METLLYSRMDSPIGLLFVGASQAGLAMIEFDRGRPEPSPNVVTRDADGKKIHVTWEQSAAATRPYEKELNEYFAGQRQDFSFPLDLRRTDRKLELCMRTPTVTRTSRQRPVKARAASPAYYACRCF